MKRHSVLLASLVAAAVFPVAAQAAAKPGSYSGTSTGTIFKDPQHANPITDKGKVTFRVRSSRVRDFRMTGQEFQCGPGHGVVKVTVSTIKLNSDGKGRAVYNDEVMGRFKITIKVTSRGRASGVVRPDGLCNDEYPARFTAKRT